MRTKLPAYLRLVAALLLALGWNATCLAAGREIPTLPASRWTVQAQPGDRVVVEEREGCLGVSFEVDVQGSRQVGNQTRREGSFRVLLAQPLALEPDEGRILFEALGMLRGGYPQLLGAEAMFWPLVQDEQGERLFYLPGEHPYLQPGPLRTENALPGVLSPGPAKRGKGTLNWGRYTTPYFYASEAGGAAQNIFDVEGGDGNAWPDGKLTFLGFEVRVGALEPGRQQGTLYLGQMQTAGVRLPYEDPYAYADSFLQAPGTYRFAVRLTNAFQGKPLREFAQAINYNPTDLQSRKQRLAFPLGPDDNYWITYQITGPDGKVVANNFMRYAAEGKADKAAPAPVSPAAPPALGYLRVNPDRHTNGVYTATEPLDVTVRVFPHGTPALTLGWRLRQYAWDTTVAEGKEVVPRGGAAFRDVVLRLRPTDGRNVYRLVLTVLEGDRRVDLQEYVLGRVTDFSKPYSTRTGKVLGRAYVKQSAFFHTTYVSPRELNIKGKSEAEELGNFCAFLDQASQMTRYLTYMVALEDFLVLPGVYDFSLLDQLMDAAADRGCALTIRFGIHFQLGNGDLNYLRYSRQRSFDGSPILDTIYGGGFSLTDQDYVNGWLGALKAVHDRYYTHPGFQGYYIMQPSGEMTVFDRPWECSIAGYEQSTAPRFREYLQRDLGLSLEQLNSRWGAQYTSWDQVQAPLPDLTGGKRPDLRMAWVDFNRFKDHLKAWWYQSVSRYIRTFDPNHVVICYTGDPTGLVGPVDYLHNGGNHFLLGEGSLFEASAQGLQWITEPHHPHFWAAYGDPRPDGSGAAKGAGWVLDWSTYIMMAQAGGGGANLHVYYMPTNVTSGPSSAWYEPRQYGGISAYDRLEKFEPILRELHSVRILTPPKQVAVLQDPSTLYCKHRTTFQHRLDDLRRWFELAKLDAVDFEDLREANLGSYRLLLPNPLDEVMSQKNVELVAGRVRAGAKLLLGANTGKYCPERAQEAFPLLRALGIQPPTGDYVTRETGVSAVVAAPSPLFAQGTSLRFYTLADLQRDLQSEEVKQQFWSWPYRWIPQTDYFGYYRDNKTTNGEVLARFASGGVALSRHTVGQGEVVVFWGTLDYRPELLKGLMSRAADWAGVESPRKGSPVPYTMEGHSDTLGRHYALMYQIQPGRYVQKLPAVPDDTWFLDDLVSDFKFGTYTGKELREQGLGVEFTLGASPLKIIRMIPTKTMIAPQWLDLYRQPAPAAKP